MLKFENDILQMEQTSKTAYEYVFLGQKTTVNCIADYLGESFDGIKNKRLKAYDLVPNGCKVIPRSLAPLLDGLLIGGVLEDSLYVVYGLAESGRGIRGFSCSLFFFPLKETINLMTNYSSLRGDFIVKN